MKSIIHKTCGGICANYSDDTATKDYTPTAINYIRKDSTQPKHGDRLHEICPNCGQDITSFSDMEISVDTFETWA